MKQIQSTPTIIVIDRKTLSYDWFYQKNHNLIHHCFFTRTFDACYYQAASGFLNHSIMPQPIHLLPKEIANEVYDHLTQHTAQAVFIIDLVPKTLYFNPACRELWAIETRNGNEDLEFIIEAVHEEDRNYVIEKVKKYLKVGESDNLEFRIGSNNNDIKWIHLVLHTLKDQNGRKRIMGLADDITKKKEYEIYLFKHNSKKNSILNILSHDLRGPISNISLISDMLKEDYEKEKFDGIPDQINIMQKVCNEALELITQYVSSENLESANLEIKRTRIELVARVLSVIETLKASHSQIDRVFKLEVFPDDKIWVETDDVKLLQIINNLISNAIKFTHPKGIIYLKLENNRDNILITLQDNGIGIPEELQPYIFDEFTKARRKGLAGEKAVGLGMSITKKMIELLGGKIWFESREGEGTTFFVDLPKI